MTEHYGDYDVESFLGKGSIGKVYLARHRRIGRRVALKTVHLEQKFEDDDDREEFYKRLQREAELCASMQHPNVVTLYDVGYAGDVVSWLATEYVEGETLLARLRRTRPLPIEEALTISADVLRGLAYAHSKGIIHRDIKPANILLNGEGRAKIADFGVARPLHSSLTATRSLVGTPNYMSPEQVKTAPVSTRSDLFSAGVVMYEMLTGTKPFGAPELSGILYNVVNLDPPRVTQTNPSVPEAIARIVARLLSKAAEDRYATAEEALTELETIRSARSGLLPIAELETMAAAQGDATTPLPTIIELKPPPVYRQTIGPAVFWTITLLLIAALASSIVLLRRGIARQQPAGVITQEQLAETAAKRKSLDDARAFTQAGRYEDAIRTYETHLTRWPHSTLARTERDEAQRLHDAATTTVSASVEEPAVVRKPRREKTTQVATVAPKEEEPKKKPSRWERVKKWYRGD